MATSQFLTILSLIGVIMTHSVQKRITYGSEMTPHSRPYQTHQIMMLPGGDVQICGGALISFQYVLTAAHCFMRLSEILQTIVILGAHNLKDQNKKFFITKTYVVHRGFQYFANKGYTKDDIALVKLDHPVQLNEHIKTISLPSRSEITNSFKDALVSEAGWGKTETAATSDILLGGISKVVEDEAICTHPKKLICTWSMDGHAPCVGDSGSPLVYENSTIIGVVSIGFCLATSYHTRVTSYLDWIEENSDVNVV